MSNLNPLELPLLQVLSLAELPLLQVLGLEEDKGR